MKTRTPKLDKRTVRKEIKFFPNEFKKIEMAAESEHRAVGDWARNILLEVAHKLEAAREEAARAPAWVRYVKSRKLLNERELHQ
jgi:hypothetical protein